MAGTIELSRAPPTAALARYGGTTRTRFLYSYGALLEYSTSGGKERACNTNPVWVCTKMTNGKHNPQCKTCVRLRAFNEYLQQPRRRSSKRRRHLNHGGQPNADEPPRNRNRGSMAQDATHPLPDELDDRPLIEFHIQPDEDDMQDAADDPTHDHTQQKHHAVEVLSGRLPKRIALWQHTPPMAPDWTAETLEQTPRHATLPRIELQRQHNCRHRR